MFVRTLIAASALVAMGPLQAATLSGNFTADDVLKIYISTGLTPGAGDLVHNKSSSWPTTASFSGLTLSGTQDLYLLVEAVNHGGPAMFVADFSLAGTGFRFANGGTALNTDTVSWTVGESSFATATATPFSMGVNGPGLQIWGQRVGIAAGAEAIWAYNANWQGGRAGSAYFVTKLVSEVPEPSSVAMLLAGLGLLGVVARRRR